MKSKTKNRLSENKIKELVRIHFGRECVTGEITELTGGMFNAIYRIERKNENHENMYVDLSRTPINIPFKAAAS